MDFTTHTKIIKINYEKLYYYEKEKRETIEKSLETKNIEIEKLKNLLEIKNKELDEVNNIEESLSLININTNEDNNQDNNQENNQDNNQENNQDNNQEINNKELDEVNNIEKLSLYTNSNTAKNGYKEEELVCNDLNTNINLRQLIIEISRTTYSSFLRINNNSKCDIQSTNKLINVQVKKYKQNRFQHLDRHWVDDLIKNIPELKQIDYILKKLCEKPLLNNGFYVDTSHSIVKLCSSNYSQSILDNFIDELNKNKQKILNFAFLGTNKNIQPDYMIGSEYVNNKRIKLIIFKIKDILIYLESLNFKITKRKTVIQLGDDSIISLQRKGGDNGKKSANQIQFKIIISKLQDKVTYKEYKL